MQNHRITSDWIAADDSKNHLELAETDEPGLIAMRNSHDPDQVEYTTPTQVQSLIQAAGQGRLDRLLGPAGRR